MNDFVKMTKFSLAYLHKIAKKILFEMQKMRIFRKKLLIFVKNACIMNSTIGMV